MTRWTPAPFVGGAYSDDSKEWSAQDTVNYIVVNAERQGTRSPTKLRGVPGMVLFADLGTDAPIRGAHNCEGLLLVVSGRSLFKVAPSGASTLIGTIPGASRVSMAHNQYEGGYQVAIANGTGGYVYNTLDDSLVQITDDGFPGAISFDYVDSYITGIEPGKRFAFISELADATSYNTLDRQEAEGSPDLLVGQLVTHREWWLFSKRSIEPYVNTGANTGTFQRASGVFIERGAASSHCMVALDNAPFWVGDDGVVYRAYGYTPQRISTVAIEHALAQCDLSRCFAFTFEDEGHKVYYLTCPDGQTWGYDVQTQEWHRRQSYGLNRWRVSTLTKWNDRWIAGDYANGQLYMLDWNTQAEGDQVLERRRITGVMSDVENALIVNAIRLVVDTGAPAAQKKTVYGVLTSLLYPLVATDSLRDMSSATAISALPIPRPLDKFGSSSASSGITLTVTTAYKAFSTTEAYATTSAPSGAILTVTTAYKALSPSEAFGSSSVASRASLVVTTAYITYAIPRESLNSSSIATGITLA
jgi:hypothetical protein